MKKKMRNACICALAVMMLSSSMVGCKSKNAETEGEKGTVKVSGVNEFPITEEKTTLSVFCTKPTGLENHDTNTFTNWYEEKTNVHIDWNLVTGDERQAINLMLASDDYSDIFYGFGFARSEQQAYYDQGVFTDMSSYIDKHAYYIKEMLNSDPTFEKKLRFYDDMILGIPTMIQDFSGQQPYKMWVYKPWMEKLNLKAPTTTDEFYNMLKAFKEKDPNGNGKADEVPLAARNNRGGEIGLDMYLMNAFCTWGKYGFYNDNGKAVFAPITEDAKEGMLYMRKLYQEGLIHPDSFVMDRSRVTSLCENDTPIVGAATGRWTTQFTAAGSSNRMNEYVAIPPLKGPKGVQQTLNATNDPALTSFSITSSCENPAVAVKWIDWFYSLDGYLTAKANEGTRRANDGELGFDGEQAILAIDKVDDAATFGMVQNERWLDSALGFLPVETSIKTKDYTADAPRQQNAYEAYKLYEPFAVKDKVIIDFPMTSSEAKEYLELRSTITAAIDSGLVGFVIGEKSIENDWDAYVQNFYDLGLKRYTEIVQKYLDSLQ